jgi:hypothetical protein
MAAHPWSLEDVAFAAIVALQCGEPAPPHDDPVWPSLISKRLLCLDFGREPPELLLTPLGWQCPESSAARG